MKALLPTAALVLTFVAGLAAAPAAGARVSTLATEVFYKCESGYAFETSGNAAHCKKPAYTDRRTLADCIVGLYPSADRIGSKDMCAATNPVSGEISVERACRPTDLAAGYTKRIVAGVDYCGKLMPQQIEAPSRPVSLSI